MKKLYIVVRTPRNSGVGGYVQPVLTNFGAACPGEYFVTNKKTAKAWAKQMNRMHGYLHTYKVFRVEEIPE